MYYDVKDYLFEKTIVCPVCEAQFKVNVVKSKVPRIASKDSDFFIRYLNINPYFYDVWLCNSCGYAAMKSDFENLKLYKKDLVLSNITPKWQPRNYPLELNENLAIERYKLALLNAMLTDLPDSTKSMISLKIGWMYRLLNNTNLESTFLRQALDGFISAYQQEIFPIYGLQKDSMMYLIGELNRRLGNDSEALIWYSKTIVNTNSSYRVKELARTGKNKIKND